MTGNTRTRPRETPDACAPCERDVVGVGVFVVELRAAPAASGDVRGMQHALQLAADRLRSTGVAIRCTGAAQVPGESRCLLLVEATRESDVALARDIAGLSTASVRPVHPLLDANEPMSS